MNRLLTLTLAFLIAVTSQQMAVARGAMMDAAGQVVLCTGHGVQTVTIGRNGDPIKVVHICPDCALTLDEISFDKFETFAAVVHIQTLDQTPAIDLKVSLVPTSAHPRGPPVCV